MAEKSIEKDYENELLFLSGNYGDVRYATDTDGTQPAKSGLEKLNKKKINKRKYQIFNTILIMWAETGRLFRCNLENHSNNILRIKPDNAYPFRLFISIEKNTCWLLSLYEKTGKGKIILGEELKKAKRVLQNNINQITKEGVKK